MCSQSQTDIHPVLDCEPLVMGGDVHVTWIDGKDSDRSPYWHMV